MVAFTHLSVAVPVFLVLGTEFPNVCGSYTIYSLDRLDRGRFWARRTDWRRYTAVAQSGCDLPLSLLDVGI